ncbi:MAG TPA: O-antigen ligase family protein [Nitrospiria bacterium]|nr:O-antigen ligase family protein [Nitrospiria bacterium]
MPYIFVLIALALVGKDVLPLGDSYVMRGVSEGLALLAGMYWFVTRGRDETVKRYGLVLAYLAVLLLTSMVSRSPLYVIVQTSSLIATVLFFIAYIESQRREEEKNQTVFMTSALLFTAVCLASLILAVYRPQLVYESTIEGERFNGLYGKSAMMGTAAGLLFGLSVLGKWNWPLRIVGLLVSLPCLYLTGSRTFWVAAAVGLCVVAVLYFKHKWAWMAAVIVAAVVLPLTMTAADFHISSKRESQILRTQSMANLSGRVTIWNVAFTKFWERPLLGYGFTIGADAFEGKAQGSKTSVPVGKDYKYGKSFIPTLHNGFIQALLDSGALGAFLYVTIIGYSLWAMLTRDGARQYGVEMFVLIFLTLSNFGETVIFSAAEYPGVFYWYIALFAMSLKRSKKFAAALSQAEPIGWAGYDSLRLTPIPAALASFPSSVRGKVPNEGKHRVS